MALKKTFFIASLLLLATFAVHAVDNTNVPVVLAGSFQIRNEKYGDLLRPRDASNAEGARIVLYPAQPWKCMTWRLKEVTNSIYQVQNHFTSKTFTTKSDSVEKQVTQASWSRDAGQRPQWKFTMLSDGTYKICDPKTDEALTAKESGGERGIALAPWKNLPEQTWKLEAIDPAKLTM